MPITSRFGISGLPQKHTHAEPKILTEVFHNAEAAHIPMLFFGLIDASHCPKRSAAGIFGMHSVFLIFLDLHFKVEAQFIVNPRV
jgi:hypothetical protein